MKLIRTSTLIFIPMLVLLLSSCKKDKTTGHLYVKVSGVNKSTTSPMSVEVELYTPTTTIKKIQSPDFQGSYTLDFGEVNPGDYKLNSALDDNSIYAPVRDTKTVQVQANKDQTIEFNY